MFLTLLPFWALVTVAVSDEVLTPSKRHSDIQGVETEVVEGVSNPEYTPGITPNDLMARGQGINCKGSSLCRKGYCCASIQDIYRYVDNDWSGDSYGNNEHIACAMCYYYCYGPPESAALCVFPEDLKNGEQVNTTTVVSLVKELIDNNCQKCGSIPIHDGTDSSQGRLTINYVAQGCGEGLCNGH